MVCEHEYMNMDPPIIQAGYAAAYVSTELQWRHVEFKCDA
jgi:hypothetical protein